VLFYGDLSVVKTAANECREQLERVTDLSAIHEKLPPPSADGASKTAYGSGFSYGLNDKADMMAGMNVPRLRARESDPAP
jgi:hypothetical protein